MQRYNTDVKVAGNNVSIRMYEDMQLKGYSVPEKMGSLSKLEDLSLRISEMKESPLKQEFKANLALFEIDEEEEKRRRWQSTNRKAKQKLIDLVACNAGEWVDPNGDTQYVRFLTLTFHADNDDTRNLKWCNDELNKYFKRMSYRYYGAKGNVFKYITVPELQKRGVWHYHIIIFNSKYIPQPQLLPMWGHGSVHIEAVRAGSAGTVASYVAKYMSKNIIDKDTGEVLIESDKAGYEQYLERELQDSKRYNPSRGLIQPEKFSSTFEEKEIKSGVEFLDNAGLLEELDDDGKKIDIQVVESEDRGTIVYCNFRVKDNKVLDKYIESLKIKAFNRKNKIKEKYNQDRREWAINMLLIKNVKKSLLIKIISYNRNIVLHKAYIREG